ncbi:MAG: hypothetical protein M3N19_12565 [Candidatus Eremiobacteraeota bacterium]|nr:hypothetical protein [Candidatus Eremiobacteraeota bacterium]
MAPFDYLSVLISIVTGLAIANLLSGVVRVMHARHRTRLYWPSIVWTILLFIILVQHWWSEFSLRHQQAWTFGGFFGTLLIPVDLYLLTALVLPHRDDDDELDLRAWYFQNRRGFFILLVLLAPLSYIEEFLAHGVVHKPLLESALLVLMGLCLCIGIINKQSRVHIAITVLMTAMLLTYIGLLFTRLPT